MIVKAQQPDGYIGTYFTVVDKTGRLKNLRDHHEMCECTESKPEPRLTGKDCCGHLLEGAIAHFRYSGDRKFLNAMLKVGNFAFPCQGLRLKFSVH